MVESLSPAELRGRLDAGEAPPVVDTREGESFDSWRVPGAVNYRFAPGDDFDAERFRRETGLGPDDEVVTLCAKGVSSQFFAAELVDAGYERVTVVEGGMEGWAAVYDHVDVDAGPDVDVVQFRRRATGCLSYLVADPETGTAAAIDPPRHVDELLGVADEREYEVEHVLDTHVHADHVSGGRALADRAGATYHLGERARDRDVEFAFDALADGDVLSLGTVTLEGIATPGHTTESVSLLVGDAAVLTGDTLFGDSVGRTELQFGSGDAERGARLLYRSIHESLLGLGDEVAVLPGHYAVDADGTADVESGAPVATTIGRIRESHSLVRLDEAAFVERITSSLPPKPANYETLISINAGRRSPGTEEIVAELETGPNNCAATSD